jgi:hypothetical protein
MMNMKYAEHPGKFPQLPKNPTFSPLFAERDPPSFDTNRQEK